MHLDRQKNNRGVALITVMLIVALATILAVSMSSRQQLDIHRSANVFNFEQAYQYILGAEAWSKQILKRDSEDNKTDSAHDDWAKVLPALPIEGGQMAGRIEDLQARFNLNNLVQNAKSQKLYIERFKRLLRNLGLKEELVFVIIDWLDSNQEIGFSGAEDNDYLNLSPPYRAANQPMVDISELLLVKGMDFETYAKLRPYVCVLKFETEINVNTASAEVISSIVKDLTIEDAQSIVEDRDKDAFAKLDDFFQHPVLKQKKINKDGLSVSSEYFQLSSATQLERITVEFVSVLHRDSVGQVKLERRSRSVL
jgi:general secretion pathway protein K